MRPALRLTVHRLHLCQAASTFPIKPDDLINRCKEVIIAQASIQDGSIDESIYADDFRFCAPFVGGPTNAQPGDPVPGLPKARSVPAHYVLPTAYCPPTTTCYTHQLSFCFCYLGGVPQRAAQLRPARRLPRHE